MRQLLTWCATRAMGVKPQGSDFENVSIRQAGKYIRLLVDLDTDALSSSNRTRRATQRDIEPVRDVRLVRKRGRASGSANTA